MLAKVIFACAAAAVFGEDRYGGYGGYGFAASAAGADPVYGPQPYSFGYDNVDEFGTKLFHKEQGDASNAKTGSYGYQDANGLYRRVDYVADAGGFRATVDTNEPGTKAGYSADAVFNANPVVAGPTASAAYGVATYAGQGKAGYGYGGYQGYSGGGYKARA